MTRRHPVFTDALLDAALGPDLPLPPAARGADLRWFHPGWLERLTRAPWWAPHLTWAPALAWLAPRAASPAHALAGALTWTAVEYLLHRAIFHLPPTTDVRRVVTFVLHRHHHRDPDRADRLVATPAQSAALLLPILAAAWPRLADPAGFAAGLVAAYLGYEAVHTAIHHLPQAVPRRLRAWHLAHHAGAPGRFGISSPLWDLVADPFGRGPARGGFRGDGPPPAP